MGEKENYFQELRNFLSGIRGDQCIIFRDQGSTDPTGGLPDEMLLILSVPALFAKTACLQVYIMIRVN